MWFFKKNYQDISPEEVKNIVNSKAKDIQLIDVREKDEFIRGHVPGSKLIPLGQIPDRLKEIDPKKEAIFICRSGNRSGQACKFLAGQGYQNVKNMVGGMLKWDAEVAKGVK